MILETERLYLRKLEKSDYSDLCKILQDEAVMYAYEHAFSNEEVRLWIERQLQRYQENGFGLWAVILKSTGELIGQAGITLQKWDEKEVHEIGYLFNRSFWHKGYAIEAASACKKYGFFYLGLNEIHSIIRNNNIASQNVAIRNGMKKVGETIKEYYHLKMPHYVYRISKDESNWSQPV